MTDPKDDHTHEDTIQAALIAAFTGEQAHLTDVGEDADLPPLYASDGAAITVTAAHTYRDVEVMTLNRGAVLELSDGSQFQITIVRSGNPRS